MQGASVALPIWIDYMRTALQGSTDTPWAVPPDVVQLPIDPSTGFASLSAGGSAQPSYFLQQYPPLDGAAARAGAARQNAATAPFVVLPSAGILPGGQ
jgi:penicillin-binding protein 1A